MNHPPHAPRVCFGCGVLVGKVVGFAKNLEPVTIIGSAKHPLQSVSGFPFQFLCPTFQGDRRTDRKPDDLTPLRPLLPPKRRSSLHDDAEPLLCPRGMDAWEISATVDELRQLKVTRPYHFPNHDSPHGTASDRKYPLCHWRSHTTSSTISTATEKAL